MNVRRWNLGFSILAITLLGAALSYPAGATAQQPELRRSLFAETDSTLAAAREARAEILAPRAFEEGMKRYGDAEEDLQRGRNLEDIRTKLSEARSHFERALEATRLANVTLGTALAARDDAEAAEAPRHVEELWRKGEAKFREAARELEGGDVNDSRERADEAEALYRQAELEAIKANYLLETWDLLARAKDLDVRERAPKTLERAEELANQAERLLSESRYDTDEPRALAQQAKSEARHAIHLGELIRSIEKDQLTIEDAVLSAENELRKIAGRMDIPASFEEGLGVTSSAILYKTDAYQDSIERLILELADRSDQVANLEARVAELEQRLGGIAEERTELVRRMEAQERLRQRFTTVESMFTREEARVLREADDVVIRLIGLSFPVGAATIEPGQFDLLTKVQNAINIFPGSRITVEGHTDSFGSDRQNQRLSQERADAVRRYLLANTRLDPSLVDALGYGESQPVASNDTREGRAKNRRTDIVIHTQFGETRCAQQRVAGQSGVR
ncbi:MAG: OmpA family protein [Gemmatimonadota bacterium]|nr:MAG: OmpA family protein [Gemmatimonadota bacterium]